MKATLLFILMMCFFSSIAQQASLVEINDNLTEHRYEFSALAKWKNYILLIPQNRKNIIDSVYLTDSSAINLSLQKNSYVPHTTFAIKNIKHSGAKNDSLYINNILLEKFDGLKLL